MNSKKLTIALGFVGLMFPFVGQAGTQNDIENCTPRPVSDFLDAQGTESTFFPPVPDYAGWAGADFATFALVDYAGVADAYVQGQPGYGSWERWTYDSHESSVLECLLRNGRAEITVHLKSENAMGFAQSIAALTDNEFDFFVTPTIFGDKVQATPGKWAFGWSELTTTFTIAAPGSDLPDWLSVVNDQEPSGKLTYSPVTLEMRSETQGPPGDPGCLRVHQVAATSPNGKSLVYSVETVDIDPEPCPE